MIVISSRHLRSRGGQIRRLLRPLVRDPGGPAFKTVYWRPGEVVVAAHDGSAVGKQYREWSFATFVHDVRGTYFEKWNQDDNDSWGLHRAYLSLLRIDRMRQSQKELLALHCDPREPDEAPHSIYKRGPHLHVQDASDPIPHAHIALNIGHLEQVLSSVDSLSTAMNLAVRMLKEEILDAIG